MGILFGNYSYKKSLIRAFHLLITVEGGRGRYAIELIPIDKPKDLSIHLEYLPWDCTEEDAKKRLSDLNDQL